MFRARLFLAAVLLGVSWSCSGPAPKDYAADIAAQRAAKDEAFSSGPDSPVLPADREKFLPLAYFPIDESYAVPAQLNQAQSRTMLQMPTSTGKIRDMERVGVLQFTMKGQAHQLTAFVEAGTQQISRLFVPFTDLTSGTETYQAGRYMDLDPMPSGIYIVDFNIAYHPYCYYNAEYDCPFPPAENRLKAPIRAGERLRTADVTIAR